MLCKITDTFRKDSYEREAWASGQLIAGIDEVGRGCLAGPVVAAAVILRPGTTHKLLRDSKTLSHDELDKMYEFIVARSWFSVGVMSHSIIDEINIYRATQRAMGRALVGLAASAPAPSKVLIDAMPLSPDLVACDIHYFIKGESKSRSIAAASIVAKVTRDRIMATMANAFPAYSFADHKGYATPAHQKEIGSSGRSFIHRKSFELSAERAALVAEDEHEQATIF